MPASNVAMRSLEECELRKGFEARDVTLRWLDKEGPHTSDFLHSPGFSKPHHLRGCDCPTTYSHDLFFSAGICGCQGWQAGLLCQRLYGRVLEARPRQAWLSFERVVKGLGSAVRTHVGLLVLGMHASGQRTALPATWPSRAWPLPRRASWLRRELHRCVHDGRGRLGRHFLRSAHSHRHHRRSHALVHRRRVRQLAEHHRAASVGLLSSATGITGSTLSINNTANAGNFTTVGRVHGHADGNASQVTGATLTIARAASAGPLDCESLDCTFAATSGGVSTDSVVCGDATSFSKILEPAESQRLGRPILNLKSLFKDFRKAGHSCGWMECIEPGGLRRSAYSGAIQDRKCRAMLVAQMSNPMHCSSVLGGPQ